MKGHVRTRNAKTRRPAARATHLTGLKEHVNGSFFFSFLFFFKIDFSNFELRGSFRIEQRGSSAGSSADVPTGGDIDRMSRLPSAYEMD